ncbi:MAG: magnesium transporter [Clostridia bacterium]|nr:magnesium transporter [Clostridia bacterium]
MSENAIPLELTNYHDNDIAAVLPKLTPDERRGLCRLFGTERFSDIFAYADNPDDYIEEMGIEQAAELLENMDADDAVDILDTIDDDLEEKIVGLMDNESSDDIRLIRSYEDDEIGSRMTTNFISIPSDLTVKQAMKELISQAGENDNISTIYVTLPGTEIFLGAISLNDLIIAREGTDLSTLISTAYPRVYDHETVNDCLEHLKDYEEDSFPVIDPKGILLGIITSSDLVEAIDEELGDDYAKLGGLSAEEDLDEGILDSMKKRIPWLIVLLFLGIAVSTVVGMFESVAAELALIVCFQSLVLDMAGNVGTQSLAVTIRVLTDENLTGKKKAKLIFKETRVGLLNGIILGTISFVLVGAYISLAKGYSDRMGQAFAISGCVGVALICAMFVSSLVGTSVPLILNKLKIDPAVASGPLITTVNDLVAVVAYYGLAWIFLINTLHIS